MIRANEPPKSRKVTRIGDWLQLVSRGTCCHRALEVEDLVRLFHVERYPNHFKCHRVFHVEHSVMHTIHFKLGKTNLTPSKDEPLASWQLVTVSFLDCVQDDINSMVQGFSLESHAKLFHDSRGAFVLSPSNRNNPMQAAATESVFQHLGRD